MKDGGPAFPLRQDGMSLRDWFAGQAIVDALYINDDDIEKLADWAYKVADAMLAAREKEEK